VLHFNEPTALTRYFQMDVAVIEVKNGETQEQAWQRHLAAYPGTSRSAIKVFHYPAPEGVQTARRPRAFRHFSWQTRDPRGQDVEGKANL
jgi:glutamine amidotransferase-like uncharacterized protein